MFYENRNCAFRLTGVFKVQRPIRDVMAEGRTHTGISYRLMGNSTFYVHDQVLKGESESVFYVPPGVDYRHKNHGPEELIVAHMEAFGDPGNEIQFVRNAGELEPLFQKLLTTWESGDYSRSMGLLYQIFDELKRKEKDPSVPVVIAPGVELLKKKFKDPQFSVAELAATCFVSEVYFRRVYRAHFGESPFQTVLNLRFDYACSRLRSGYYTQKQVAELSGFSEVNYFRTAFTKRYGLTPSAYAKKK